MITWTQLMAKERFDIVFFCWCKISWSENGEEFIESSFSEELINEVA
jgi:hypothetical protein